MSEKIDYYYYKKNGICPLCRKRAPAPGRIHCFDCLDKFKDYYHKNYEKKKEYEKKYSARKKEIYWEKKENGICVKCTKPAKYGMYCYEHSIKVKRASIRQVEKRKIEREEGRKRGADSV